MAHRFYEPLLIGKKREKFQLRARTKQKNLRFSVGPAFAKLLGFLLVEQEIRILHTMGPWTGSNGLHLVTRVHLRASSYYVHHRGVVIPMFIVNDIRCVL